MTRKIGSARLHKNVVAAAKREKVAPERAKRWVAATAFFQLLNGAVARGTLRYGVDGGFSVELRHRVLARTSEDIDLILAGEGAPVDVLRHAIDDSWADFSFAIKSADKRDRATRVLLQVRFNGVEWCTLKLDVLGEESASPGCLYALEYVYPPDISQFGLPTANQVPCLSRPEQMAHWIHAVTKPAAVGERRDRSRNLIDLYLFDTLSPCSDEDVLAATVAVFEGEPSHAFRLAFEMPAAWAPGLDERVAELGLDMTARGLEAYFQRYVARILGVNISVNFEYRFVILTVPVPVPNILQGVFVPDEAFAVMERLTGAEGFRLVNMLRYPSLERTHSVIAVLEREKGTVA